MAFSVPFTIYPPEDPDIVTLHIFEAVAAEGPYVQIDETSDIGVYPTYITHYTTELATNAEDWFAIQWENADGVLSAMSAPVKGGTSTFIGEIVERVSQRDSSLSKVVIRQEAEAAVERYFNKNPYEVAMEDLAPEKKYQTLAGLTYMVMARSMLDRIVKQSNVTSATIGLVSMRSGEVSARLNDIEQLIVYANNLLGLNVSLVMLLEDIKIGSSVSSWQYDQSRLVLEVGLE